MKFKSEVQLEALNNATVDTDKFLVSDSSTVKYRTGAQVLSDIGGQAALTNPITGTGTLNYVSKFTSATSLGNSQIFDNGTNVLIGTISNGTGNKLQIQTTGSNRLLSLYNTTANGGAKIEFFDGSSNAAVGNVGGNLLFYANSRDTERMRITSTGNVGIGTTVPDTLLHVSSLNSSVLRLESTNTALGLDAVVGEIQFEANDASGSGTGVKAKIGAYSDVAAGNAVGLRFFTGDAGFTTGTEKMRILANGFVGIGTPTPTESLQVAGNTVIEGKLKLQTVNNGIGNFLTINTPTGFIEQRTAAEVLSDIGAQAALTNPVTGTGTLNFVSKFTSTGSTLGDSQIFDNGTNVGIGTASPAGKLNALGDIIAGSFTYTTGVNLQNRTAKSLLYISTDGVNNAIGSTITYSWVDGGQGPLKFNNTSGEVMRLDAIGKLGVGTTNPTSRIHSVTSAAGPVSYINLCAIFGDNTSTSTTYPNSVGVAGRVLTSDGKAIYGDATTGGGWGGYFDGKGYFSGNVGIGTTSPPSKVSISGGTLSVSGSGSGYGVVKLGDPTDVNPYVGMYRSAAASIATSGNFLNLGGYDGIAFTTGAAQLSGQPERMRITSAGNVGIGTTNPTQLLHVAGNARVTGSIYDSSNSAGTSGQVLSSTGTGTSWVSSGIGIHSLIKPSAGQTTGAFIGSSPMGTSAAVLNRLYVVPYIPAHTITCSSLQVNVAVSLAGLLVRILIYSDDNGTPGTKIYESADLDCSTTGIKTATTTQTFQKNTTYWIGTHASANGGAFRVYNASSLILLTIAGIVTSNTCYISPTFGSAPTTFGTPTYTSLSNPFVGITI